ncbi:MAG: hypothetical protein K2P30_09110 [Lachnospiraceae bacterium]|nr:hypothetical protein [Lachnospiraceae bacterium]MDE6963772.1 hypothetical protein [Lachnospiraceae bacterium]
MYLLSIVGVIVMTVVMGFISGLDVGNLFDFISLLLLLLLLIPMLISGGLFKDFNNAFRLGIGKRQPVSLMELKRAKEAVCLAIKVSLAASAFIGVMSAALVLFVVRDMAAMGPSLAVSMISLIYGLGLVLILLPLDARLTIKIQEFINEKE